MLLLYASPHKNGHTARLWKAFRDRLPRDLYELIRFDAYDMNVQPCVDCRQCAVTEGCRYADMDSFDTCLRESDLLVVASPVYCFSFPAPMKAVLDRFQRYYHARFSLGRKPSIDKHRQAVLLLSMGAGDEQSRAIPDYQLRRALSVMNTAMLDTVAYCETDSEDTGEKAEWAAACAALDAVMLDILH